MEGGESERNIQRAMAMIGLGRELQCEIVLLPECLALGWTLPSDQSETQPIPMSIFEDNCNFGRRA